MLGLFAQEAPPAEGPSDIVPPPTPAARELARSLEQELGRLRAGGDASAAEALLARLADGVRSEAVFATPGLVGALAVALHSAIAGGDAALVANLAEAAALVASGVPGGHEALASEAGIGVLMAVLRAGDAAPPRAQARAAEALSQVALARGAVARLAGTRDLLHRAAMLLCRQVTLPCDSTLQPPPVPPLS